MHRRSVSDGQRAVDSDTLRTMEAIIFDLDGVIMDSESMHLEALRAVVTPEGLDIELHEYVGCADADAIRRLYRNAGRELTDERLQSLLETKNRAFKEQFTRTGLRSFEGTLSLLRNAAAAGIPVAVCTASQGTEAHAILTHLQLTEILGCIITADDVAVAKPDPAGYRLAARTLGVDPARAVAIEDSVVGVRAACDAGLNVVAVLHTTPRERLADAHLIVESSEMLTLRVLRDLVASKRDSEARPEDDRIQQQSH